MNEPKNEYESIAKNHPVSVRLDISEKQLMEKTLSRFKDVDQSQLIRMAIRKFCELVLYQGSLTINMIEENGT